jgi:hypothetical protein
MFYQEFCSDHGSNYKAHKEDRKFFVDGRMLENLGTNIEKTYWNIDFNTTEVGHGVPYSYNCIIISCGGFTNTKC